MAAVLLRSARLICLKHCQPACVSRAPALTGPTLRAFLSNEAPTPQHSAAAKVAEPQSRYKERPWEYLLSEEYIERYGTNLVWTGYKRKHKGGIPPQKTRKTCIRGDEVCANPCPLCRDPNVIVHPQNVKLLQQFISPQTGSVYDASMTGVCQRQQKKLLEAVDTAQDHGLLPFQIPYVELSDEDYSNSHSAVGSTPPPYSLTSGDPWYPWYGNITPDEKEVVKVKKTYKKFLKEECV